MALTEQEELELLELEEQEAMSSGQDVQPKQVEEPQRSSVLAQLVRMIMRSSPLEQMKTTQTLMQSSPDVQPGQSLVDYQKSIAQTLQPREQEIARQGTVAQLQAPIEAGLAVSGVQNPLGVAKGIGKFALLEGIMETIGVNKAIQDIQQPETKDIADIGKLTLEGVMASKKWIPEQLKEKQLTNFAGRIVDSLIKPRHKEYLYGRDPGKAIAKEGIIATSMTDLQNKVQGKIDNVMTDISTIRSLPENFDKKVDVTKSFQPLKDAYTKLNTLAKETKSAEINKLQSVIRDLVRIGQDKDPSKFTVSEAYQMKEALSLMQDWESESAATALVNGALRKTYHGIDAAIDTTIPKLKVLNERVSNLISAKQAINHRIESLRKSEPLTFFRALDLPFAAFKTTLAKTGLASLLSTKYPKGEIPVSKSVGKPSSKQYNKLPLVK